MTERSEYLAEYREMLILHTDDESWEERVSSTNSDAMSIGTIEANCQS